MGNEMTKQEMYKRLEMAQKNKKELTNIYLRLKQEVLKRMLFPYGIILKEILF